MSLCSQTHSEETLLQLPGSLLHFCTVTACVLPCPVHPQYTACYSNSPIPGCGFPFAPLGCLSWSLAHISSHSVPQSSQSFGKTVFLHACSVFPLRFLHLLSPLSALYHSIKQRSLAAGQRNEPERTCHMESFICFLPTLI